MNNVTFIKSDWEVYLRWLKNQIYKLLPLREEKGEWKKFAESLIWELKGADNIQNKVPLMSLIFKLSALTKMEDFRIYRKTIFECINLINKFELKLGEE